MTTRDELVALADDYEKKIREKIWASTCLTAGEWVYLVGLFQIAKDHENCPDVRTDRLASRQEVSVTVEELATLLIDCWKSGKAPLQVARALLAEYAITKRTTEG